MKRHFTLLTTLLIVMTTATGWSQRLPKIQGSGVLKVTSVTLEEKFNTVLIDGDIEVELVQARKNGYSIESDDNLINAIEFNVENKKLHVYLTHRITKKKEFKVTLKVNDIERIELKDGAKMNSQNTLKGEVLTLVAGKSTKYDLDVAHEEAVDVEMYSDAEGTLKIASKESEVKLDDRASLKMYTVLDLITAEVKNSAELELDGTIQKATLEIKEGAKITAKKAAFSEVDINLSNNADVTINAKETITLYAQDSSVLQVYGDPKIIISGLKNKAKILKKE